jgi:hypothetical protein
MTSQLNWTFRHRPRWTLRWATGARRAGRRAARLLLAAPGDPPYFNLLKRTAEWPPASLTQRWKRWRWCKTARCWAGHPAELRQSEGGFARSAATAELLQEQVEPPMHRQLWRRSQTPT